ncbi:MAG: hypothetical protein M3Q30_27735 [Actinomycetota bacterium]|nr:hypothetical protein [Actinomycetota bacterium]
MVETVSEEVSAARSTGSFQVFHDGCSADVELRCELVDEQTCVVLSEEFAHFVSIQAALSLDRSGSSSG